MRAKRISGRLAAALALATTTIVPATASAAWAEPQTICTGCTEADSLVDFAEAPNGAAVAAWHGDQRTYAAYRGPKDAEFGAPYTVASGGKPQFIRAAIGADGTAAVATWLPAVAGSQVVARITPSTKVWANIAAPAGSTNAHVAVGPTGEILGGTWDAPGPTDQSYKVYNLPPGATAWSAPATLYTLAAPFTSQQGIGLAGNGMGTYVAYWSLDATNASQDQGYASYSTDGTSWTAPEPVGTPPNQLAGIGIDGEGNAASADTGATSWYRSYLDNAWRGPDLLPFSGSATRIGFDAAGNGAAIVMNAQTGQWAWARRSINRGDWLGTELDDTSAASLAVAPAGDVLVVRQQGTSLITAWASTIGDRELTNQEPLPRPGTRLVGVGLDTGSLGTAVWSTGTNGSVLASTRPPGSGGEVALSQEQLLTNQRISQAAVLRSNGALAALDAGLPGAAFRVKGFGPPAFGPSVPLTGTLMPGPPNDSGFYRVPVPTKTGSGGTVTLSRQQLLINQKISQAAVLRSNAVRDRLSEGLTASQIASGAIGTNELQPGLAFGPLGASTPGTPITVPSANGSGGEVTLSEQQLLINQRISQAAVRRSNLNIAILQSGLTQADVAPGGIAAQNVTP